MSTNVDQVISELQSTAQTLREHAGKPQFLPELETMMAEVKTRTAGTLKVRLKLLVIELPLIGRFVRTAAAILRLPQRLEHIKNESLQASQGLQDQVKQLRTQLDLIEDIARANARNIDVLLHENHIRLKQVLGLITLTKQLEEGLQGTDLSLRSMLQQKSSEITSSGTASLQGHPSAAYAQKIDAFYQRFEERFRGSPEIITERLRAYVPYLQAVAKEELARSVSLPLLDLGCGRGEWLQLAKAQGLQVSGVDLNESMANYCNTLALDVKVADAIQHLQSLPIYSCSVVTGFHIVEHLPFEVLFVLLCETYRVLRPGGLAIFETPNPENLAVVTGNFYTDPTHRNPLPPPTLGFLMEEVGFAKQDCLRLRGVPAPVLAAGTDQTFASFAERLYVGEDYAIIGHKAPLEPVA